MVLLVPHRLHQTTAGFGAITRKNINVLSIEAPRTMIGITRTNYKESTLFALEILFPFLKNFTSGHIRIRNSCSSIAASVHLVRATENIIDNTFILTGIFTTSRVETLLRSTTPTIILLKRGEHWHEKPNTILGKISMKTLECR